jgi:hypothetical protein
MSEQPYNITMSWQQLIKAVQADMAALYAGAAGAGTVTSVGLAAGSSGIVVSGTNPVTVSGTIDVDLSAAVKAELAAAATALQPISGLSGSYTYASLTLNASGQITAVASGTAPAAGANPTGSVGLAAVNGVATTFLRSDGAPALSQNISPTWTGNHVFAPTSGIPLLAKTNSGANAFEVTGTTTGPTVEAYGPTAAALVDLTPDTGSFTITYTGFSSTVTGTANWVRIGKLVILTLPAGSGTSNATSFTATGLPSEIQPATANTMCALPANVVQNSGAYVSCNFTINGGTLTFFNGATETSTTWTASGTKGFLNAAFAVYSIL